MLRDMVTTRFVKSVCLGMTAATDSYDKFMSYAEHLDPNIFLQVMSDETNTNFLNILNKKQRK